MSKPPANAGGFVFLAAAMSEIGVEAGGVFPDEGCGQSYITLHFAPVFIALDIHALRIKASTLIGYTFIESNWLCKPNKSKH